MSCYKCGSDYAIFTDERGHSICRQCFFDEHDRTGLEQLKSENAVLRERLARLAELLQEILEHDVANLNTEHEFFACHTYGSKNMPVWVEKAKRAIADAKEAK